MVGQPSAASWYADRASVAAACGVPAQPESQNAIAFAPPSEIYDRVSVPQLRIGIHNGRPAFLQSDGRPAMYLDIEDLQR